MIVFVKSHRDAAGGETRRFHSTLAACMDATADLKGCSITLHSSVHPLSAQLAILFLCQTRLSGSMGWVPSARINRSFLILLLHLIIFSLALHIKTFFLPAIIVLHFLVYYTLFLEALPGSCSSVYHYQLDIIQSFLQPLANTVSIP